LAISRNDCYERTESETCGLRYPRVTRHARDRDDYHVRSISTTYLLTYDTLDLSTDSKSLHVTTVWSSDTRQVRAKV